MKILCEPVAVRHIWNTVGLTRSHIRGTVIGAIREGRPTECQAEISVQSRFSSLQPRVPAFGESETTAAAARCPDRPKAGLKQSLGSLPAGIKIKGDKNMQKKQNRKLPSFILCIVLIVATALLTTGCNGNAENQPSAAAETNVPSDGSVLGTGSTQFTFTVVDIDGGETQFEIHTDKTTVGEALTELGLISGEDSEYGLYVQTVNGISADYDKDGVYWAFYVNGEYAQTGVDSTPVEEGGSYSFKAEK